VSDDRRSAVRIEPLRAGDLDAVLQIERASFQTPWPRQAFVHELERNRVAGLWVARSRPPGEPGASDVVVGYLCLWAIADEIHVTNLAVHPAWRGQGIGRFLLATLLARHRAAGARRVLLEVRPGNVEARRLYEGLGFREVGRRRGYYVDTGEDALLLEARLDEGPLAADADATRPGGRNPFAR
jgi:ribosomal-protein-alanine N-acetyltransferase